MATVLEDFLYDLPDDLIAQKPAERRSDSRLMILDRAAAKIHEARFAELADWLPAGCLLVVNNARVLPVRLFGQRETGGRIEVLMLDPPPEDSGPGEYECECLTRPSRRLRPGVRIQFGPDLRAEVMSVEPTGRRRLKMVFARPPIAVFRTRAGCRCRPISVGRIPGEPRIRIPWKSRPPALDRERYQTVYASVPGAVAAPTAGLHFDPGMLDDLRSKGYRTAALTLMVGYGTFSPVRERDITLHRMHEERVILPPGCVESVNRARREGRPVTAVGTTVVRSLEHAARQGLPIQPLDEVTDIFIYPGFKFRVIDHLVTNFHLPGSTLIMLVAAMAGREFVMEAYRRAVEKKYRFFSYGDAMLIL